MESIGLTEPHLIAFEYVVSDEAQVWRMTNTLDKEQGSMSTLAWVKVHKTSAKAQLESQAIQRWGQALSPQLKVPKVIAVFDTCLVLSHCQGQARTEWSAYECELIASSLANLHELSWQDQDTVSLTEAFIKRSSSIFKLKDQLMNILQPLAPVYSQSFLKLCTLLSKPSPLGEHSALIQRSPCHRDFRSEHLLFKYDEFTEACSLSLIDWGQSRPDHWSSDWTKLYLEPLMGIEQKQQLWQSYWQLRFPKLKLSIKEKQTLPYMLHWSLALHTLNTLKWAYMHQKSGQTARHQAVDQSRNNQIWKRALYELEQMNNFTMTQFTL